MLSPSPNPPIPRSTSDPKFSTASTSNHLGRSTTTATRRKGGGRHRTRPRRSSNTKPSELTEESLEEFNRRNAENERKSIGRSPYYDKGINDQTLNLTRQQNLARSCSPGRESQGTVATSSSSISTVFVRIQEWSTSCFKGKSDPSVVSNKKPAIQSFSSVNTVAIREALELRKKELSSTTKVIEGEEKPLRERASTAAAAIEEQEPVLVEKRVIIMEEKQKEVIDMNGAKEFVWANMYRPKALKDFICNRDKAEELIDLVQNGRCSHYIFEGPHGVGKRTMVWALLKEAFGVDNIRTRKECKEFTLRGEALPSIKVNVEISSKHVEVNTSELGGYEKHVVVELIKDKYKMALDRPMLCDHTNCSVIILHEADKLSTDAQLYIRWMMERSKGCNKIFFCCHDASKLQTIKSMCKVVQLLPPSNKEIVEVLEFISAQEGIQLPPRLAERIAESSMNNLRQAIRSFEASWKLNYPLQDDQVILTGWEEDIANIAKNIIDEQSPKQLYVIRGKLQSLIEHNVSPEFIFITLIEELKKLLDENFYPRIDALYKEYNRDGGGMFSNEKPSVLIRKRNGESEGRKKNINQYLRIEEFTAKFMSCYKSSMLNSKNEANKDVKCELK